MAEMLTLVQRLRRRAENVRITAGWLKRIPLTERIGFERRELLAAESRGTAKDLIEAADTIERQEQEIERLRQIVEAYEEDRDPYEDTLRDQARDLRAHAARLAEPSDSYEGGGE